MKTPKFSAKLETLAMTVERFRAFDARPMAEQIRRCSKRSVVAVGSGGSHVAASFFDRCFETLGFNRVLVQTPMELVVENSDLRNSVIWLFSASANNADIAAAAMAARDRGCTSIVLCTRNINGDVAKWVEENGGEVLVVPVAEEKDGYLATHSLVSTCTAILLATNILSDRSDPDGALISELDEHLSKCVRTSSRQASVASFSAMSNASAVIVISDPSLRPVTQLLETSLWETALCSVQATDMRNFAHGRHSWLHHRADETIILALTGIQSQQSWSRIREAFGASIEPLHFDYQDCGRKQNLLGIIDGLFWLEAMGAVKDIDPAKPGFPTFGRDIYEDRSLAELAEELPAPVRHKLNAKVQTEGTLNNVNEVWKAFTDKVELLAQKEIGAVVLDYDGTVVSTDQRYEPPRQEIIKELIRLYRHGVTIAFASGRGGSLGQQLRSVFPGDMLADTLVGYFNGGHIVTAEVDLDTQRPAQDAVITEIANWLEKQPSLLKVDSVTPKEIQLSIDHHDIRSPVGFMRDLEHCPAIRRGAARIVASGHSFDIIPNTSSKIRVVEALENMVGPQKAVLSIGDSGTLLGNDYDLVARDFGVSVDRVCPDLDGCWSLYGERDCGPDALLKILMSMIPSSSGGIRIKKSYLNLDFLA